MKINTAIAAAILAYCADTAPLSRSSTKELSSALPTSPIPLSVSPIGLIEPKLPIKQNTTESKPDEPVEFPTIIENGDRRANRTSWPRHLIPRPFRHGPVLYPQPPHFPRSDGNELELLEIIEEDREGHRQIPGADAPHHPRSTHILPVPPSDASELDDSPAIIEEDHDGHRLTIRPFPDDGHGPAVIPRAEDLQKNRNRPSRPGFRGPVVHSKAAHATRSEKGKSVDLPTIIEDDREPATTEWPRLPNFRPFGWGGHGPVVFPTRSEHDKDENKTENPFHPKFNIYGGGHGPVVFPKIEKHGKYENKTEKPSHDDNTVEKEECSPLTGGPLKLGFISVPVNHTDALTTKPNQASVVIPRTVETTEQCMSAIKGGNFLERQHDQEHTIIDECEITNKTENWKEGDDTMSRSTFHSGAAHTDHTSDFHNGIDLADLLREHHLIPGNENNESDRQINNSTLTKTTKSNDKDGSRSSEIDLHVLNMTIHRTHHEAKIKIIGPISFPPSHGERSVPLPPSNGTVESQASPVHNLNMTTFIKPTTTRQNSTFARTRPKEPIFTPGKKNTPEEWKKRLSRLANMGPPSYLEPTRSPVTAIASQSKSQSTSPMPTYYYA